MRPDYLPPKELKDYEIICKVKGNLPRREHEDGELNEAILRAFEDADLGCLFDTDLADEIWEAEGKCSFLVTAYSIGEAMDKADEVFLKLCSEGKLDFGDLENVCLQEYSHYMQEFPHIKFNKDLMYSDNAVKSPLIMLDLKRGADIDKYIYTTQVGTTEKGNAVYYDWVLKYDKEHHTISFEPSQPEGRCFSPDYKGYLRCVPDDIAQYAKEIAFKEFALRKNLNLNRWEKTDEGYKGNFISVTIDLTDNDLKALGIKELVDNCENYGKCKEIARNAISDMINEKGRNNKKEKTVVKE